MSDLSLKGYLVKTFFGFFFVNLVFRFQVFSHLSLRGPRQRRDVEILKGHISKDQVHIFVSVPPYLSVSKLVQSLKGKTSRKMLTEFKELSKKFWGRHVWAAGYFAAGLGNVTDEVIMS
jgi:REP element-mobilizing transposase RayT